jgi:hypothetical protein
LLVSKFDKWLRRERSQRHDIRCHGRLLQNHTCFFVDEPRKCVQRYHPPWMLLEAHTWCSGSLMIKFYIDTIESMFRHDRVEIFGRPTMAGTEKNAKKAIFARGTGNRKQARKRSNQLTFFSVSSHLLMAIVEDPVRSLRARTASLMWAMVVMMSRVELKQLKRNKIEPRCMRR